MLPTPGGDMLFQANDNVIAPAVRATGAWEPAESALLIRLVKARPGTFLDLGAHVGYHAVQVLAAVPEVFDVICVEPNPLVHDLLGANLQRWWQNTVVVEYAAWSETTWLHLWQASPGNGGDWRVSPEDKPHGLGLVDCETACRQVDARSIDSLLFNLASAPKAGTVEAAEWAADNPHERLVGVIKSDLQGCDHIALKGASRLLTSNRPDVVCEFDPALIDAAPADGAWDPTPAQVIEWYQQMHYAVRRVDGTVMSDPEVIVRWASSLDGRATIWLQPIERFDKEVVR
jgi:FkbM family methyltransferase